MDTNDITIQILREIRDSIGQTNARLDETNARAHESNARLDHLYAGQLQLATEVHAMGGALGDIRELLVGRRDLRHRVERCEREIVELKRRIPDPSR